MANFILRYILSFHLVLASLAHGYKIDDSCTKTGHRAIVDAAMKSAFDMAQSAERRLSARPWADDTKELIGYLFAKEGHTPSSDEMQKTYGVFRDIGVHYRNERTGTEEVPWTDVVSLRQFNFLNQT